jgi:hypothetical protein
LISGILHDRFFARVSYRKSWVPLPDVVIRAAIQRLCSRTATRLAGGNAERDASFADDMAARAIAEYTDEANARHYEVPAAFFVHVPGPNRKYSSCLHKEPESSLRDVEEEAHCLAASSPLPLWGKNERSEFETGEGIDNATSTRGERKE